MFTEKALQQAFDAVVTRRSFPAGTVIMRPGDVITQIPIVAKGSLRILAQDPDGKERFLYHILPGETCSLSLTCCEARKTSAILAVVEEDAELQMVPARYADEWMVYPEWRRYVGAAQAQRFGELLETIETLAFRRMDDQLWDYLVKRAQATGETNLRVTHQDIAQELGSPREVITRLLQQLQRKGLVTLSRGAVQVHMSSARVPSQERP
ncbi:MAG: Crp/Fnr family transcriptional regulator [Flavobacteriales bacterium]|nr:Crp/Fnr family transcriptional regulator [Flavobacteriales bacterium]MEB2342389.1 Crp/Fnr family transcriptional regulator [Flavobacteriia bacterium]